MVYLSMLWHANTGNMMTNLKHTKVLVVYWRISENIELINPEKTYLVDTSGWSFHHHKLVNTIIWLMKAAGVGSEAEVKPEQSVPQEDGENTVAHRGEASVAD